MTRSREDKERFLETLRETPMITIAAKRLGIARATLYRWMQSPAFKEKVEEALTEGRMKMSDLGEAMLVKKAQEGDMRAIKFLLSHNNDRYIAVRTVEVPCTRNHENPLGREELEAIQQAMTRGLLGPPSEESKTES